MDNIAYEYVFMNNFDIEIFNNLISIDLIMDLNYLTI